MTSQKTSLTGFQSREDIHHTAKWSAPSPGGVTRLCADENDKKVRDWFKDQLLALGADYKVRPPVGQGKMER
jgi:N-carbamoyl-L-amino-acid hydrolase